MRITLRKPSASAVRAILSGLRGLPLSYWERGGTRWQRMPLGYAHDEQRAQIGQGEADWRAAKRAIAGWRMFPSDWADVSPKPAVAEGVQTAVVARVFGFYVTSPTRVVYTVDEPDVYGFAYGTLAGHAAQGEELFSVARDEAGRVYYRLRVMSRPSNWLVRLFEPIFRKQQARFRKTSLAAMRTAVRQLAPEHLPLLNRPVGERLHEGDQVRPLLGVQV